MIVTRVTGIAATLLAIGIAAIGTIVQAQSGPEPGPQAQPRPSADNPAAGRPATDTPAAPGKLGHGDGQADGKKSLGGSGEMIEFVLPAGGRKVSGIKVHGSRYGMPNPPDESFLIYFLDEDASEVIATRMAPYSLFERGPERWVDVAFSKPVEVSGRFWVALDFRAHQSKGVYVSFDASTAGKSSRAGLPGLKPKAIDYGDWMIEVVLAE